MLVRNSNVGREVSAATETKDIVGRCSQRATVKTELLQLTEARSQLLSARLPVPVLVLRYRGFLVARK